MRILLSRFSVLAACLIAVYGLLLSCSVANADYPLARAGTVSHTLSVADDIEVVLDAVRLDHSCSPYLFVRDPWSQVTLPVLASAEIHKDCFIEVTGHTATVQGIRIVIASQVRQYVDSNDQPVPIPPKTATVLSWPHMLDISLAQVSTNPMPIPQDLCESLNLMQTMETESPAFPLTDLIVTAGRGDDFSSNTFYVEPEGRFAGRKVVYTGTTVVNRDALVSITGTEDVDTNGEPYINATDFTATTTSIRVKPIMVVGRSLAISDGDYLQTSGLLVRCFGKITYVDTANDYFYLDDGLSLNDGSGHTGPKVSWNLQAVSGNNPEVVPPTSTAWYLYATGICSSETTDSGATYHPILRLRRQEDIIVKNPADTANPTVTLTNPSGIQISVSPNNSVQLGGTAMDSETGVAYVQVKIDGGDWHTAFYDAITHAWRYAWDNPTATHIWVRAMDFAGHTGDVQRDVTVKPQVICVSKTGNDSNNGWTWSQAKLTIQAGLDTANSQAVRKVWVGAGAYNEHVTLRESEGLYGGFAGTETSLDGRSAFPRQSSNLDSSFVAQQYSYVISSQVVSSYTTVDGFTLQNGSSYGIRCFGTHVPTIINNKILHNQYGIYLDLTYPSNGWIHLNYVYENGSGIYCVKNVSIIVEDNHIHDNGNLTTRQGVGIACYQSSSPTINRNWIENNNVGGPYDGGGICCYDSSPLICDNVLKGNEAMRGGAIYISGVCSPIIACNTMSRNVNAATGNGGAVFISYSSSPTIANNVIYQNNTGVYRPTGSGGTATLTHNCSWNVGANYSGVASGNDFVANPYLAVDEVHLTINSTTCRDNAYATQVYGPNDIDCEARTKNGLRILERMSIE